MGTPKKKKKTSQLFGDAPAWLHDKNILSAILFALSFLLYANTISHDYTLDDAIVITDNKFVQEGISGLSGIFGKDTFYGFFQKEGKDQLVTGGRYRPLSLAMFAVGNQFFGNQPMVNHLMNVLLYGLLVVLLFRCLLLLLSRGKKTTFAVTAVAFFTALLFMAHPVHTEVVANIKGRDEILALLGSLGSLFFAARYAKKQDVKWLVASGLSLFLGLLSKENAIMYVGVVPVAVWVFYRLSPKKIMTLAGVLLLATGAYLGLRSAVIGPVKSDPPQEMMNNPFIKQKDGVYSFFSPAEKSATITYGLGKYAQLSVFPYPLSHDYYPRAVGVMKWSDPMVLLSLVLVLALVGLTIWGLLRRHPLGWAGLAYGAPLLLLANIFFPVGTHVSERFLFMPSVGLCFALGWGIWYLVQRKGPKYFKQVRPAFMGVGALVLVLSAATFLRNGAWKDNYTLFTTDVEVMPNSAKLQNAAGGVKLDRAITMNEGTERDELVQEAVGHLQKAVEIHPNYKNAWLLMGNAHNVLKAYDEANNFYDRALAIDPNYEDARQNKGITYRDAGRYWGEEKQDLRQSIRYLELANATLINDYETKRLLGVAYGIGGRPDEAVSYFTEAANLRPDDAQAWFSLGVAYLNGGNEQQGNFYIEKARGIDPNIDQKRSRPQGN